VKAWFTDNIGLKLTALLLTLILYIFVLGDRRDDVRAVFVPFTVTVRPEQVLLNDPVKELKFTLRGKPSSLDRLEKLGVEPIIVNADRAQNGRIEFGVDLVDLPPGIAVVSIKPPAMDIELDTKGTRSVRVFPRIQGVPRDGYRVVSQRTVPTHVEAVGPNSKLDDISALTEFVNIGGRAETLSTVLSIRDLTSDGVELRPDTVELIVEIEPIKVETTFSDVAVEVHNTRYRHKTEPQTVEVTLQGPKEALQKLTGGSIACVVDAKSEDNKPPGTYKKRVEVTNLPPEVRVVGVRPPFVSFSTMEEVPPTVPDQEEP
jgi:YbbR domain-containing protein